MMKSKDQREDEEKQRTLQLASTSDFLAGMADKDKSITWKRW